MAKKYKIEFTDDDMDNIKLYIDGEEKQINFLKLTYHTDEGCKKRPKESST